MQKSVCFINLYQHILSNCASLNYLRMHCECRHMETLCNAMLHIEFYIRLWIEMRKRCAQLETRFDRPKYSALILLFGCCGCGYTIQLFISLYIPDFVLSPVLFSTVPTNSKYTFSGNEFIEINNQQLIGQQSCRS